MSLYKADKAIVAALKRIEPKLSVHWVETPQGGRWSVWYDVPYHGDIWRTAREHGRELQQTFLEMGYIVDSETCEQKAYEALKMHQLQCYVTEDDGSYRPLDGRIVEKFQRMDSYRQNLGISDWQQILNARADALKQTIMKDRLDVWEQIRKDKIFQSQASDILHGLKPMRSVYINWEESHYGARPERIEQAPGGRDLGSEADSHGTDGDCLAGSQGDSGAGEALPVQ